MRAGDQKQKYHLEWPKCDPRVIEVIMIYGFTMQ